MPGNRVLPALPRTTGAVQVTAALVTAALVTAAMVLLGPAGPAGATAAIPAAAIPAAAIPAAAIPAAAIPAADVHGDDEQDRYVGTGGLLLPDGVDRSTRAEVAGCAGCQWRLATPCLLPESGHPFDGQSPCLSVVRGCPAMQQLLRAWFRQPGESWREIGLVCIGADGPVTVAEVGATVHDRFVRSLPAVVPTFQPRRGVVTQVPVLFDSGQPGGVTTRRYDLLGQRVTLSARPSWTWRFGDGGTLATDDPGGPFPQLIVAHVYRRAGEYQVAVRTRWTAEFTVGDLGPFPVVEAIEQDSATRVPVGEGRALLRPA